MYLYGDCMWSCNLLWRDMLPKPASVYVKPLYIILAGKAIGIAVTMSALTFQFVLASVYPFKIKLVSLVLCKLQQVGNCWIQNFRCHRMYIY